MSKEYDIAYGRHSNIPECCIQFFITRWDYTNQYGDIVHAFSPVNYIPCPKCFANGNFNKLKMCDSDCGKECYKEFSRRFESLQKTQNRLAEEESLSD
jgi:hypothetical protein